MALTAADVDEFIALLHQDVGVRTRVRDALVADEMRALQAVVARLADNQTATTVEVRRLDDALIALTGRVDQLAERMDQLTERMDQLAERMDQLAERLDQLTVEVRALQVEVAKLVRSLSLMEGRQGNMDGELYELRWARQLGSRLGVHFRRVRELNLGDFERADEARDAGLISRDEWRELNLLDATALVRDEGDPTRTDRVAAVELSRVIGLGDVSRARRRADILLKAGIPAVAVVGGETILPEADDVANAAGVVVLARRENSEPG